MKWTAVVVCAVLLAHQATAGLFDLYLNLMSPSKRGRDYDKRTIAPCGGYDKVEDDPSTYSDPKSASAWVAAYSGKLTFAFKLEDEDDFTVIPGGDNQDVRDILPHTYYLDLTSLVKSSAKNQKGTLQVIFKPDDNNDTQYQCADVKLKNGNAGSSTPSKTSSASKSSSKTSGSPSESVSGTRTVSVITTVDPSGVPGLDPSDAAAGVVSGSYLAIVTSAFAAALAIVIF
ncbi:hypothetical protein GQ42DRAFT_161966 [Ramicandelaber brevisporus]|nr:hypothetical protein GQ42DRAFT_161966 [Ramicandelaber brevisporus]